jgi:large subunit ribosomal protein L15
MKLNTLSPEYGSKRPRVRVGRGIGSTLGKTCGRGHKGQKSRAGGYHKIHFEGGQMPIQRRLPKMGFSSRVSLFTDQLTLSELMLVNEDVINLITLKNAGLITKSIKFVKVILSGEITKPVKVEGLRVTAGALKAIEAAGGSVQA